MTTTAKWLSSPESKAQAIHAARNKLASDYCRYIESHGFRAEDHSTIQGLCVVAFIPYTQFDLETGDKLFDGIQMVACKSFSDVRAALGY